MTSYNTKELQYFAGIQSVLILFTPFSSRWQQRKSVLLMTGQCMLKILICNNNTAELPCLVIDVKFAWSFALNFAADCMSFTGYISIQPLKNSNNLMCYFQNSIKPFVFIFATGSNQLESHVL